MTTSDSRADQFGSRPRSVPTLDALLCRQIKSCLPVSNSNRKSKPSTRPVDEADEATSRKEGEHKVSWQLAKTDCGSVFVKTDEKQRITYIAAYLRPGKEMPFEKIARPEKTPVLTDRVVTWDVVRSNRPLIRVVARGSERKASSITMFIVKRPRAD